MSTATDAPDMLSKTELRDIDEKILDYLGEGRVTPLYCRKRMDEERFGKGEYSRGYVQQRLGRLVEHGHAANLLDTGIYELRDDPRQSE